MSEPTPDLATILATTSRQMGMDLHTFQEKYLTDTAFHALVTIHAAALERQVKLGVALRELLGALDEYIDYDDEYHKVGPFVHRVKALLAEPAEEGSGRG